MDVHCEISISAVDKKHLVSEYVLDWCCIYWLKDDLTNIYYNEREVVSCFSDDLSQALIDGKLSVLSLSH